MMNLKRGEKVSYWLLVSDEIASTESKSRKRAFLCRCKCGVEREVRTYYLTSGKSTNCGCVRSRNASIRKTKHGKSETRNYRAWQGMLTRCSNPNSSHYHRYGGRGIKVCDRWLSYDNFLEDMGNRPKGHTIDRIDNDKGYNPENCRWVTNKENSRNKSARGKLNISGVAKTGNSYQASIGVDYNRVYLGCSKDFFEACCMRKAAENKYWTK